MISPLFYKIFAWWRHQMETFSALLALCAGNSPVTGEFPSQRPVTQSFDVFLGLCLNKRLSKHSRDWWFDFFRMHKRNGLKFDMQMYADCIFNCLHLVMFCWFSSFWRYFDLVKQVKIAVLWQFLGNALKELAELILSYPKKWKRQLSAY